MSVPNHVKQLESYILKSTSEKVTHPDSQMFIEICNIINSRADMPKYAIALIRKRIMSKNPKTVYLCLELLEVAANACEMPFHTQVASKDFVLVLNSIVSKEIDKKVFEKLCHVLKYWTQIWNGYKDILPSIFEFHALLEKKGVEFPGHVESKYAYLLKNKPKPSTSSKSYGDDTKDTKSSGGGSYFSGQGTKVDMGGSHSSGSKSKGMSSKLRGQLDIIKENIVLINQMIDAADHDGEDVRQNDVLTDLLKTLKSDENKIQEFITKQSDEDVLSYTIQLNDDMLTTFERYKSIRAGRRPKPFIMASEQQSINDQDRKVPPSGGSKNSGNNDLLDLLGGPEPSGNQNKPQAGNSGGADIFDLGGGNSNQNQNQNQNNQKSGGSGWGDFDNWNNNSGGGNQNNNNNSNNNPNSSQKKDGGSFDWGSVMDNNNSKGSGNLLDTLNNLYQTSSNPQGNTGGGNQGGFSSPNNNQGGNNQGGNQDKFDQVFGQLGQQQNQGGFQTQNNYGGQNQGGFNQGGGNLGGGNQGWGNQGGNQGWGNTNTNQGGFNQGNQGGFNQGNQGGYNQGGGNQGWGNNNNQGGGFNTTQPSKSSNPFDMTDLSSGLGNMGGGNSGNNNNQGGWGNNNNNNNNNNQGGWGNNNQGGYGNNNNNQQQQKNQQLFDSLL